jgi:hypothetical protein
MAERTVPHWWTRRERIACRFGPWISLAWYVAPRSSRERWAAFADLMASEHDSLAARVELLADHGVDALRGAADAS